MKSQKVSTAPSSELEGAHDSRRAVRARQRVSCAGAAKLSAADLRAALADHFFTWVAFPGEARKSARALAEFLRAQGHEAGAAAVKAEAEAEARDRDRIGVSQRFSRESLATAAAANSACQQGATAKVVASSLISASASLPQAEASPLPIPSLASAWSHRPAPGAASGAPWRWRSIQRPHPPTGAAHPTTPRPHTG